MDLPPAAPERGAHTDAYALLGVKYDADDPEKEGRGRLRALARTSHPDKEMQQRTAGAASMSAGAGEAEVPTFAALSAAAAMLAEPSYVAVLRGAAATAAAELDAKAGKQRNNPSSASSAAAVETAASAPATVYDGSAEHVSARGMGVLRIVGGAGGGEAQTSAAVQQLEDRVHEVLYEVEYRRLSLIRAAALAAAAGEDDEGFDATAAVSGPSSKRRSESKRRRRQKRKRGNGDNNQNGDGDNQNGNGDAADSSRRGDGGRDPAGGMFGRPADPRIPTQHLFIAPAGPKFGATAEDISLALSAVVPGEVTGVTIPGLSSANVYASFRSAAAAAAAKAVFDRKTAGAAAQKLFGRSVSAQFSELILPLVAAGGAGGAAAEEDLTPAELLRRVRATMTTLAADEEAGNLPMGPVKTVRLVRCPLCSAREAEFQRGRPLRMHLMSPLHSLTAQPLADTIALADALARRDASIHGRAAGGGIADIEKEELPLAGAAAANVAGTASAAAVTTTTATVPTPLLGVRVEDAWFDAAQRGDLQTLRRMAAPSTSDAAASSSAGAANSTERAGARGPRTHPSCTDQHGSTALHWAAGSGRLEACKLLVHELGVKADEECITGRADRRNALHWAARNGQIAVCAWLVDEEGISMNAPTADGTTPFHWAAWQAQFACCRWLRDAGADVAAVNTYGCNAVHWAALTGNLPMCAWLAEMGVPLDLSNKQGHSPLHKAAFKGESAMCTWLLRHGGPHLDPQAVDRGGYTPAMIARERGFPALAQLLEAAGTERAEEASAAVLQRNAAEGVSFRLEGTVGKLVKVHEE